MPWLTYQRGGLIQERPRLHSAWDVYVPGLATSIGRVESYWDAGEKILWRSLDHWYCDWHAGFRTRDEAAQDLATTCPRALALQARLTVEGADIASGAAPV